MIYIYTGIYIMVNIFALMVAVCFDVRIIVIVATQATTNKT
jgi:hypothetical protein